jgi:hypothetical protein
MMKPSKTLTRRSREAPSREQRLAVLIRLARTGERKAKAG